MYKLLFVFLFISCLCFAQSYFPLEIGNRWDYKTSGLGNEVDTFSVNIVGDTLMPNGQNYFVLDRAMGPSRFLYADSNFIYYYDESDSTDTPIYDLNAPLEKWYSIGMYASPLDSPRVQLAQIDTAEVFGVTTRILYFNLDWLVPFTLGLSDKFGPLYHYTAHHDPYWTSILGCIISDTTYGTLVSVEETSRLINNFTLFQNYPNPFNPKTKIRFTIPQSSNVTLSIFTINGEKLVDLVKGELLSGTYEYEFDGSKLSSEIYFYQLKADNFLQTKKLMLLK
ncbi:MAG: T9SS type A sorting domain-containing protein [Melioribacteraceae bacterium]